MHGSGPLHRQVTRAGAVDPRNSRVEILGLKNDITHGHLPHSAGKKARRYSRLEMHALPDAPLILGKEYAMQHWGKPVSGAAYALTIMSYALSHDSHLRDKRSSFLSSKSRHGRQCQRPLCSLHTRCASLGRQHVGPEQGCCLGVNPRLVINSLLEQFRLSRIPVLQRLHG